MRIISGPSEAIVNGTPCSENARRARQLEQFEFLHIPIQEPLQLGGVSAIKLLP